MNIPKLFLSDLDCDFENFDSCSWKNVDDDDADWVVGTGSTPSFGTGPSGGYPAGKFYVFFVSSRKNGPD